MTRMNWDRLRHSGRERVEDDHGLKRERDLVTIRCRRCGHAGQVTRWAAENRPLTCRQCGWKGGKR